MSTQLKIECQLEGKKQTATRTSTTENLDHCLSSVDNGTMAHCFVFPVSCNSFTQHLTTQHNPTQRNNTTIPPNNNTIRHTQQPYTTQQNNDSTKHNNCKQHKSQAVCQTKLHSVCDCVVFGTWNFVREVSVGMQWCLLSVSILHSIEQTNNRSAVFGHIKKNISC